MGPFELRKAVFVGKHAETETIVCRQALDYIFSHILHIFSFLCVHRSCHSHPLYPSVYMKRFKNGIAPRNRRISSLIGYLQRFLLIIEVSLFEKFQVGWLRILRSSDKSPNSCRCGAVSEFFYPDKFPNSGRYGAVAEFLYPTNPEFRPMWGSCRVFIPRQIPEFRPMWGSCWVFSRIPIYENLHW